MRTVTAIAITLGFVPACTSETPPAEGRADAGASPGAADAGSSPTPIEFGYATRACMPEFAIRPSPEGIGSYATAGLVPPSYPFTVDRVSYRLYSDGSGCGAGHPHRVMVFTAGDAPPASPSMGGAVATFDMPATSNITRWVEQPLANPVTLTAGQKLMVAVQIAHDGSHAICMSACPLVAAPGRNWWSNATAEPFAWTDMYVDDGITSSLAILATGTPAR